MRTFWKEREPFVWATGIALTLILLIALSLFVLIFFNGLGVFWPAEVVDVTLKDGSHVFGEKIQREKHPLKPIYRFQLKTGNRDLYGLDFRWIEEDIVLSEQKNADIFVLEREEYGNFYGVLKKVVCPENFVENSPTLNETFYRAFQKFQEKKVQLKQKSIVIATLSNEMEFLHSKILKLNYRNATQNQAEVKALEMKRTQKKETFAQLVQEQEKFLKEIKEQYQTIFEDASGTSKTIPFLQIVRYYQPNKMSSTGKIGHYLTKVKELFWENPRESNTEGGLFPAIFGTVAMVFLMSIFSFPLGVIASVYLKEYAKDGFVVRLVRIAVNNLAGIPSIVYGVFGLGFFVYVVGGTLDQLFFPQYLPTPTFGTGGLLWASLTLSLLTVPVVIVATEEALSSVPGGIREASLALGATKFQSLIRVVLPMASPGIMTGFILAMARAAGEVAPLMLTGVVKLAPSLPLDGTFPYVHLDQKFMHLGFHIYDVGFQSPNVEAAKPMVFVTTFILILVVLLMNSVAIYLREQMKKRYQLKAF